MYTGEIYYVQEGSFMYTTEGTNYAQALWQQLPIKGMPFAESSLSSCLNAWFAYDLFVARENLLCTGGKTYYVQEVTILFVIKFDVNTVIVIVIIFKT
jgi:hypothetical protein